MKKVFFIAIYILTFVVMIGTMRILFHTGKEVENIVQINVIDAKYDNGFIVIELGVAPTFPTKPTLRNFITKVSI